LPVEARERVEDDLTEQRLDGGVILRRVVQEYAWDGETTVVEDRNAAVITSGVSPFQFGPTSM
jgi:hypothetical protein